MKARSIIMLRMFAVCAVILVCAAIIGCTTVPYAAKKQSSVGKAVLGISPHEKDISIKAVTLHLCAKRAYVNKRHRQFTTSVL